MAKGIRLDIYLTENKLSISREKSQKEILAGWVKINGETVRKPSRILTGNEIIKVERPGGIYVSRGGEKLMRAVGDKQTRTIRPDFDSSIRRSKLVVKMTLI